MRSIFLATIIIAISLFTIGKWITNTQTWFFWRTGMAKINFAEYAVNNNDQRILGEYAETPTNKRIEIDLTSQKLYAYEGAELKYDFNVSTGLPWFATPTGEARAWLKSRYVHMRGSDYDLPGVPHVIFIYGEKMDKWKGYAIHGAYWHLRFGHPISHGCINVPLKDMEQLYGWFDSLAIPINIYGTTPKA